MITIPYDMTGSHVPVLAGELIEVLDPQPGETVVDCTFGAGGLARLMADRIGPTGTLIAIDRDPAAQPRFEDFAAEAPCRTRFVGAAFADALAALREEGVRADIVYADLGISSMQVDTFERGFSYSYDAPLDMRIAVNDERGQIDAALPLAWALLAPGGRFAGISFHSGEDRRVKRFLVQRAEGCTCPPRLPVCVCGKTPEAEILTRRAIAPTAGEIASNPRSASARLRAARKLDQETV